MQDKSSIIFGNPMDEKTIRKGNKSKAKFIKKYGDDTKANYHLKAVPIEELKEVKISNLVFDEKPLELPNNAVVIGNIRMGFGHYRISIAMASAAKALGYEPYWLDLASFDATGSKMIRYQNDLYSTGSKLSQKSHLFNHFVWEPMNSEGFRKITYNSTDQKNAELLAPIYNDLPKDVPFIATHVWPSQGAIHAGLTHVVNAIPDNWPMGLHLSEGAIHTVQTPFAYLGYKMLNGMAKTPLKHMPDGSLYQIGHYVDHELVSNVDHDCQKRIERLDQNKPLRFLLTVGGAGAGADMYLAMIEHLIPYVRKKKAVVMINFGDHLKMWEFLKKKIKGFEAMATTFFDSYDKLEEFAKKIEDGDLDAGIYCVYHKDIFEAVYSTNLLMRHSDVLITKPSELSFYPVPKLMMRHIGGHEVYGAVHASEIGDSTFECSDKKSICQMIDCLMEDHSILKEMCSQIVKLKDDHMYDGAYEAVKLAVKGFKTAYLKL